MVRKKTHGMLLDTRGDRVFCAINNCLMLLVLFITAYPMYFTVLASISDINEVAHGNVYLIPKGFTLDAYRNVFQNRQIWTGYENSLIYAVCGTAYGLIVNMPLAYGLSKKYLKGRSALTWFFLFTMYFSGGLIPSYLLVRSLGLYNTRWVMIIGGISVYHMIIIRTYFQSSIPEELYESAYIDGAGELTCFLRIALPLSKPILAVMALYGVVGQWNAYFSALIYITNKNFFPLQVILRNILILNQQMMTDPKIMASLSKDAQQAVIARAAMAESMKYALIFIASAPLLIAYPFVQKFFVKGIMIGSLKG